MNNTAKSQPQPITRFPNIQLYGDRLVYPAHMHSGNKRSAVCMTYGAMQALKKGK